jgi:hypothetical protein
MQMSRHLPTRVRAIMTAAAVALVATIALAFGGAATADAAGPNALFPGQSINYPTWGWGSTKFCAENHSYRPGMVDVRPHWSTPPGQHDELYVPAYGRKCIDRWWFGVPIEAINNSYAIGTGTVLTVRTH